MSPPKKRQGEGSSLAKVNLYYCVILITLGMCVGYYIIPYFSKRTDQSIFNEGVLYGILYYKEYLHRNGTFDYVSDSCVSIQTNKDSFMIYK